MAVIDKLFRWGRKPFKEQKNTTKKAEGKPTQKSAAKEKSAFSEKGSGAFSHVLIRPHASEKAVLLQEKNQYVFEVSMRATKQDVAHAVNDLYGTKPTAVRMITVAGKKIRFGKTQGRGKEWKKAIVAMPEGKKLELYKS